MTDRKQQILSIGLRLWPNVTARAIAREIGTSSHDAITYYWGNAAAMKNAIAAEAVRIGDARVVPMLITGRHSAVASMDDAERRRWLLGNGSNHHV